MRLDKRRKDEIRDARITRDYLLHPEGSVLMEIGNTKIICTAMIDERVPHFLRGTGQGWITAEYSMLPGSTGIRKIRNASRGKIDGRTQEIQRLIGRSLRSVIDLNKLGERTIWIDCDVIQADGGTRTASVTGSFVAVIDALNKLKKDKKIKELPVTNYVSAISVGLNKEGVLLDLCYEEDSQAIVDMNIVMTEDKRIIEIQGTGEKHSFSREQLNKLLDLGEKGNMELIKLQKQVLGDTYE